MFERPLRRRPQVWVQREHGHQKGRERPRGNRGHPVLVPEDGLQVRPAERLDVPELAMEIEIRSTMSSLRLDVLRDGAEKFDTKRKVIFIARILLRALWVEEVVSGNELKHHARQTPYVRGGAVAGAQDYLRAAVLARLNLLREVPIDPACVAQVSEAELRLWVLEWVYSLTNELRLHISSNEVERLGTRATAASICARLVGSCAVRSEMPWVVPK